MINSPIAAAHQGIDSFNGVSVHPSSYSSPGTTTASSLRTPHAIPLASIPIADLLSISVRVGDGAGVGVSVGVCVSLGVRVRVIVIVSVGDTFPLYDSPEGASVTPSSHQRLVVAPSSRNSSDTQGRVPSL